MYSLYALFVRHVLMFWVGFFFFLDICIKYIYPSSRWNFTKLQSWEEFGKSNLDLTLSQRFPRVISDKNFSLYLFLREFCDGDSIDSLRNQFQNFTISWCQTPLPSLYPFYLVHQSQKMTASLPLCMNVLYIGRSVTVSVFWTFDHSCCSPLGEECSEFVLLKFRTFDLSELSEEAVDVKH